MSETRANRRGQGFVAWYTLAFLICAAFLLCLVHLAGRELIWFYDGLDEDFPAFAYIGPWLLDGLLSGDLQTWNYGVGYGADSIVSLAEWMTGPFFQISAFLPTELLPIAFELGTLARLYLAGLAFGFYMRRRPIRSSFVAAGSLFYAFSGYLLLWGATRHPFFIDPAIILPMVLLGADKILEGERPIVFILGTFLSFYIWFYWAYMISIFLLLYCLLRYFTMSRRRGLADFLGLALRFLAFYVVGALMASVILLPVLSEHLNTTRLSEVPLLFDGDKTAALVTALFGAFADPSLSKGTTTLPPVPALLIVFFTGAVLARRRALVPYAIAYACVVAFALVPWFGSALNGFSYSTDRWAFAFALCSCCLATYGLELVSEFGASDWRKASAAMLVIFVVLLGWGVFAHSGSMYFASLALLPISFGLVWAFTSGAVSLHARYGLAGAAVACLCAVLVAVAGGYGKDAVAKALDAFPLSQEGDMAASISSESARSSLLVEGWDSGLGRMDWAADGFVNPQFAMYNDRPAVEMYTSFYQALADEFRSGLLLPESRSNRYATNDSRAFLELVSGVGGFVSAQGSAFVPYGYDELVASAQDESGSYDLHAASSDASLVFAYDAILARSEYDSLSPLQKQEALTQACVIEDEDVERQRRALVSPDDLEFSSSRVDWTVDYDKTSLRVDLADRTIVVDEPSAYLTLAYAGLPDSETYVQFDDLYLEEGQGDWPIEYYVSVSTPGAEEKVSARRTPASNLYVGKRSWLANLGYSATPKTEVTISFSQPGEYSFDELSVFCQPMHGFARAVERLNGRSFSDVRLQKNEVSFEAECADATLAYVALQYAPGWRAYVDGEEAPILRANVAFMALELPAGSHVVTLEYETPNLRLGLALSAGALLAFVVIAIVSRRRKAR